LQKKKSEIVNLHFVQKKANPLYHFFGHPSRTVLLVLKWY